MHKPDDMLPEPTPRLIARLKAGEWEQGFAALFRRFHDGIYRSFPDWIPPAVRSELTQEVFFKVYRSRETLPEEHFEPWLHRVARRTFLTWYESENRHKRKAVLVPWDEGQREELLATEAVGAQLPSPLDEVLTDERRRLLHAAIEDLPRQMRSCVLLRVVEDQTIDEIARSLRLTPGAVKSHLFAARARLKRRLSAYFSEIDLARGEPG